MTLTQILEKIHQRYEGSTDYPALDEEDGETCTVLGDNLELILPAEETDDFWGADEPELTKQIQEYINEQAKYFYSIGISNKPKRKGIMSRLADIPKRIKKVLDAKTRALYQLDWIDEELELTEDGQAKLMDILHDEYADKLGELAQKEVERIKAEEKK